MGIFKKVQALIKGKPKGFIAFHRLEDFWEALSVEEKELLRSDVGDDIDSGDVHFNSASASHFLQGIAFNILSKKEYKLAEKLLNKALELNPDPVDEHFIYNTAIKLYYKQRDQRPDALEKCKQHCERDIELFPKFMEAYDDDTPPRIPAFQQLAIILEKEGKYDEAIEVCEKALEYGLKDGTKGGFEGRIEKYRKKLAL